ncbi:unnamed protein product [Dicrocoelium dendriticum]|nr:unnamed protein product [Dicrocoelium dendriticum]
MSPTLENKGQHPCDYLRSVKVISQQEWQRLNDQLNREAIEQKKLEDQHLANEKLKQQSQEMVKNWTNTFLGARQKKLDERAKRLADEEKAKVAIDIEEAKFQAEQRKAAIEEAKLKLYYQTDRVKRFHSALTLAETLKERDVQLEFKELCKARNAEKERVYVEQIKKEMEAAALKEQQDAADRKAKNFAVASEVVRQIKEREENQKKEHEEMLLEGEQLKRLLIQDQQERERLMQTDKQQAAELRKFYLEQIEDNEQIRTIERLKEEEEDEKRRIFAAAKKKMMTLRMLKERELFEAREAEMERIRNSLSEQMKQKKDDEEERIARVIAQREEAERLKESEKAKATAKIIAEIEAQRLETIQRHRREQEEAKLAELEEVRARNAANRMVAEREAACAAQRNERIREMSRDHLENAVSGANGERARA